jgi:(p)ppGpp synthase/HD superfamily hydrolase
MFGRRVADLVHRVTNEEGKNRRERHEKTYPKIQASDDAITLKLADRIANIEASYELNDEGKMEMYAKEYKGFRDKLYKPGSHDAMWRHLDFLIGYDGVNTTGTLVD